MSVKQSALFFSSEIFMEGGRELTCSTSESDEKYAEDRIT